MAEKAKLQKITAEDFDKNYNIGDEIQLKSTGKYKDTSLEGRVRAIVTDVNDKFSLEVLVHEKHAVDLKEGMTLECEYSGIYTSPRSGRTFINTEAVWSF